MKNITLWNTRKKLGCKLIFMKTQKEIHDKKKVPLLMMENCLI